MGGSAVRQSILIRDDFRRGITVEAIAVRACNSGACFYPVAAKNLELLIAVMTSELEFGRLLVH